MVKVSDIIKLPFDSAVSLEDYLVGTDVDSGKQTKSYKVKSLFQLFSANNTGVLTPFSVFDFSTSIDYKTKDGVFNANSQDVQSITTLNFSVNSKTGVDLTEVFDLLRDKKEFLKISLTRSSLEPFINIFNVTNVNTVMVNSEVVGFTVSVNLFEDISVGDLIDDAEYNVDFQIIPLKASIDDLPIYESLEAATSALGLGKVFRYSKNNIDGIPSPNSSITAKT